jgi:hypothetical protein
LTGIDGTKTNDAWRPTLFACITLAAIVVAALIPPVAQDPAYHNFADTRPLFGIDHFWNVASNAPFVLVGLAGLLATRRRASTAIEVPTAEWVFCIGVLLVGPGSAWYHLEPTTPTLFWDRMPMTIAFMALFSAVLGDTVSPAWGRRSLWPLVLVGLFSALYWIATERAGAGDLRPYGLVQFLPMVLIPLLLVLYGTRRYRARHVWWALVFYGLAKGAEFLDVAIMDMTDTLSGHALKHLLAAVSSVFVLLAFEGRRNGAMRG